MSTAPSGLEDHVGYWLRFVSNHVSHAFRRKVEAEGITVAEWVVLRALLRLGATHPSALADDLGMTRGAISKLVDRLLRKALVERSYPGGDKRFQLVNLTEAGRTLVPKLARLADENDREFFGHLDEDERAQLIALMRDVVRRQNWKDVPVE